MRTKPFVLSCRIDKIEQQIINEVAGDQNVSSNDFVRKAVFEYIKQLKDRQNENNRI